MRCIIQTYGQEGFINIEANEVTEDDDFIKFFHYDEFNLLLETRREDGAGRLLQQSERKGNRMLKYDYNYGAANEDDFVQNDNKMFELTVRITLHEYRTLVSKKEYLESENRQLKEEILKLQKSNESLSKIIYASNPKAAEKIFEGINSLLSSVAETESEEEPDDAEEE